MRKITAITASLITALTLAGCASVNVTVNADNATKESTFIYLSNIEDIPFDRAVMASGLSSNTADYFSPEEAVFVGWKE